MITDDVFLILLQTQIVDAHNLCFEPKYEKLCIPLKTPLFL